MEFLIPHDANPVPSILKPASMVTRLLSGNKSRQAVALQLFETVLSSFMSTAEAIGAHGTQHFAGNQEQSSGSAGLPV